MSVLPLYAPDGPSVGPAAFAELAAAHRHGRAGLLDRIRRRPELAALAGQGLLTRAGRPTPAAARYLSALDAPTGQWTVTGRYRGSHTTLRLWISDASLTALAGPSAESLRPGVVPGIADDADARLDLAGAGEAATIVCAWAAVRPLPPGLAEPIELPLELFGARADGGALDDPGGTAHGTFWQEPWFVWDVATDAGARLGFINSGRAGHFAFGQVDDALVRIVPVGSGEIWRALHALQAEDRAPSGPN